MTEEQSWKDIRDQRRKENFVGRGDEVRIFTENFGDIPNYMIFAVTGEGGVGKSTLLDRFTTIATAPDNDSIVIICDDKQTSPVSVMGHIASELAKLNMFHKEFDERYKTYSQLRQEIESDPKVPRSAVKVISMGITDFTIKSLRKTPGVGVFFEYADEKAAGDALGELIQYGISKWGNKDEVQLLREPERILTPLFLELIQKAYKKKRLVIMFDVFERTGDILSSWLLALFDFQYGKFSTRLTFVIGGRDSLEQHWTELAGMICYIRLETFTLEETRLYLSNQGITDAHLVNQIYEDTGGLPVLVELLAATKPRPGSDLPDISKDAVERFLQWTPQEEKRRAALLAAVPRQFDRDILSAVLENEANEMFNWLSEQSYIRRTSERGWFYHEKVRELMLRYIWRTTPSELTNAHTKLAEHFASIQTALGFQEEVAYQNETWCVLEQERVYHILSALPDQNIPEGLSAFLHAFRWKWQFSEKIARTCMQVSYEKRAKDLHVWSEALISLYLAYDRDEYEVVIERLNLLETQNALSTIAKSSLFSRRGEAYRGIDKYEESLIDLNRAIELDDKYALAIANRGETYRVMGKYSEALADLNLAIDLDKKSTWAIYQRGTTHHLMDNNEEALVDFTRAIELDNKYKWALASRGEVYRLMKKYEEALVDFTHAIELDDKYAWAIANRGETYRVMGKYEEALAAFTRAIEVNEKYVGAIAFRGLTYHSMKKYEEALADFIRAIELDDKYAWAIANRAETYRLMKKYEEALADFTRAIELDDKYAWALASRGQTYHSMKKNKEALADFTHAIELDDKMAWVIANRGQTYQSMEKYEEALADFTRAIELDDKYAWAIANRGETYRVMGKYEEALADFTRAIELDDKYAWALASRGQTYHSMKKYEEALSDFTRAIELDDKIAWVIANRAETYRLMKKYEEALSDFTRAIELDDKYAWALAGRGQTYRSMNKYEEAILDFTYAFKLNEKYAWAIAQRGRIYRLVRKYEEALTDFNTAIELDDKMASAFTGRALTYRFMGRYEESLIDFRHALELNPQSSNWTGNYAGSLLGKGDFEEGLDTLDRAIEGNLDSNLELSAELWFYAFAHWTSKRRQEALKNLKNTLQKGGRSPEWDFSENIAQARKDKHPDARWLQKLADVITNRADIRILDKWSAWKKT